MALSEEMQKKLAEAGIKYTPPPEGVEVPKVETPPDAVLVYLDTGKHPDALLLAESDADPRWDGREKIPLEKWLVEDIAKKGVEVPIDVTKASDDPLTFYVNDGRQRTRAIGPANALRKKHNWGPPLKVPLIVTNTDDLGAFLKSLRLNSMRVESDPLVVAAQMSRSFDLNMTEEEIAEAFHTSLQSVRNHLAVLPYEELHDALRSEKISVSAAAELVRNSPEKVESALKELLGKGRVTQREVRKKSGKSGTMTRGDLHQAILDLQTDVFKGPDGEKARWAAIAAFECALDDRRLKALHEDLKRIAKGEVPKMAEDALKAHQKGAEK